MEKENTQSQELQKMVDTWSNMNRYSFFIGTQRGILSAMNVIMIKYTGMTFEQYSKSMIKPQLHQMASVGQCINLLANLLKSIDELIKVAEMEAKKEMETEGEKNEKDTSTGSLA